MDRIPCPKFPKLCAAALSAFFLPYFSSIRSFWHGIALLVGLSILDDPFCRLLLAVASVAAFSCLHLILSSFFSLECPLCRPAAVPMIDPSLLVAAKSNQQKSTTYLTQKDGSKWKVRLIRSRLPSQPSLAGLQVVFMV